jgi:hypothetical protein
MRVRVLKYCQELIDGHPIVLDCNKIVDLEDEDALRLIDKGIAEEIVLNTSQKSEQCENKMINIIYKKRGRPRKEG